MEFSLTPDDIHVPARCPILGIPLRPAYGRSGPRHGSPSLERLNPEVGYVRGNVAVISHRANQLKSNLTVDELILVGLRFRELDRCTKQAQVGPASASCRPS
jgi:hypothetical protein